MIHEYTWSNDEPVSSNKAGLGAQEIAKTREMAFERLAVDHYMDGILTAGSDQDGTHKQVTLKAKTSTPATLSGAGKVYSKTINGIVELCYLDSSGHEVQITTDGNLTLNSTPRSLEASLASNMVLTESYQDIVWTATDATNLDFSDEYPERVYAPVDGFYIIDLSIDLNSDSNYGSFVLYKEDDIVYSWANQSLPFHKVIWLELGSYIKISARCIDGDLSIVNTSTFLMTKL